MAGLTDDELKAMTDEEIRTSIGYSSGKLEEMRRKNEYYFLGLAKGDLSPPEIEGRSTAIVNVVRNTVLGMQAPLIKTFCGSENVVEFSATTEEDEDKAQQATDYINYLLRKKNPGYQIISTWITDALIQKVGIVKVWWDDSVIETREEYRGQTDVELALLLDDKEVEPIEQKSYPDEDAAKQKQQQLQQMEQQLQQMQQQVQQASQQQPGQPNPAVQAFHQALQQYQQFKAQPVPMLYDVTVRRTKTGGQIRIENVPPEEFLISKKAKQRIIDSPFVGHRVKRTISDLTSMGYKNVDMISSDENAAMNAEYVERAGFDDESPYNNDLGTSADPSLRMVWITECYLRADVDGDGIAEWRKVVRAGNQILENVECDGPPFVSLCPTPLSHRFFGLCPADLAQEPMRQSTNMLRSQLDNMYLQVNGRYFAVENQVNLDDLLTSRPGGVVRIKQPGAVGRLDQATSDTGHAMELMQWYEAYTEESTGWTKQSQGGNGLQLNQTATQSNIVTNRADSRIEIISRQFAETGFTDLFKMMLKLVTQHQNKAETVKLGNKWANIDPREWTNQFDLTINVGLGTGNKDQQVQHLMALIQAQGAGLQIGITTPENMYHSHAKLAEALGYKNASQFFTDPDAPPDPKSPPKPPRPDPEMVKIQAQGQIAQQTMQAKAQLDQQHEQARQQFEAAKLQMMQQAEQQKAELAMQVAHATQSYQAQQAQQQNELEAQREMLKFQHETTMKQQLEQQRLDFDKYKAELDASTKITVAQIAADQANAGLMAAAQAADNDVSEKLDPQSVKDAIQLLSSSVNAIHAHILRNNPSEPQ